MNIHGQVKKKSLPDMNLLQTTNDIFLFLSNVHGCRCAIYCVCQDMGGGDLILRSLSIPPDKIGPLQQHMADNSSKVLHVLNSGQLAHPSTPLRICGSYSEVRP